MNKERKSFCIGILSAMPEEVGVLLENLEELNKSKYGSLDIYSGIWRGSDDQSMNIKLFSAWSGWGKVNSSYAATRIICEAEKHNSKLDFILFTGVAGAADPILKQRDIVIANSFVQHDMDARPMFNKFVIPNLDISHIETNSSLQKWAFEVLKKNINDDGFLSCFGNVYSGLIATGDKFVGSKKEIEILRSDLSGLLAVEMEGASVAQVLYLEDIPFLTIRVISDQADEKAAQSFTDFLKFYEKKSWNIIKSLLLDLKTNILLN